MRLFAAISSWHADGNTVTLYDVSGRVLATKRDDYTPMHFNAPASGAYMIRIGNHPAKRVVVTRQSSVHKYLRYRCAGNCTAIPHF